MAAFHFSLEKVLRYRQHQTQLAEDQFRIVSGEVTTCSRELENAQAKWDEFTCLFAELASQGLSAEETARCFRYARHLDLSVDKAQERLQQAQTVLKEKRELLVSAMRDEDILDTLKEQKRTEHNVTVSTSQQKNLDELGGIQYWRAGRAGGVA